MARLAPGTTIERAEAEIEVLVRGDRDADGFRFQLARLIDLERAGLPSQLALLGIPAALLLLIACGNVAALLLGENYVRAREVSTRFAIGAGRMRILRQFLTESVILGALGSVPGVFLAFAGTAALARFAPETSRIHTISVNAPVLLFACAAGILSGILFGLIPALQLSRRSSQYPERWGSSLPAQKRWGDRTLIALQVAFTVALLITGGLFARTVDELFRVDLGFDPERIISIRAAVPDGRTIPEISST